MRFDREGAQIPPRSASGIPRNLSKKCAPSPPFPNGIRTSDSMSVNNVPPSREDSNRSPRSVHSPLTMPVAKLERYIAASETGRRRECGEGASIDRAARSISSTKKQMMPQRADIAADLIRLRVGGSL